MVDPVLRTDDVEDLQNELMAETAARREVQEALETSTREQAATQSMLNAVLERLATMSQQMATIQNASPPQGTSADVSARLQPLNTASRGQRDTGKGLASTSSALPQAPRQHLPSVIEGARASTFHDRFVPTRSPRDDGDDDTNARRNSRVPPTQFARTDLTRRSSPVHFSEYDEEDMDLAGDINPGNFHPPLHDPIENMNMPEGWVPPEIHDMQVPRNAPRNAFAEFEDDEDDLAADDRPAQGAPRQRGLHAPRRGRGGRGYMHREFDDQGMDDRRPARRDIKVRIERLNGSRTVRVMW